MVYPENVTVLMRTELQGKPAFKTIDTTAKFKSLGDQVQIDLNLMNRDLLNRHFVIDETSLVYHGEETYQCLSEAIKIGRPHHLVIFAKLLG